jgi:uroporphyrinogen decarboxylase
MQTSYEVIFNAVHFNGPDRLPLQFPSLGMDDTAHADWNQIGTGDSSKRTSIDEWGCAWSRTETKNMGQVTGHPLSDWNLLKDYQYPDPDNPDLYEGMDKKIKAGDGKYRLTGIFMLFFERLHSLRGFENTLTDLYLEQDKIAQLADKVVDFDIRIIENISSRFPNEIHGFQFTDDWGTEQSGFIQTELWDDFFKPRYKKIFDAIKDKGWDVWMHSCGKINQYIPSLLEIGCDVLNLQQPTTNGIIETGKEFAGKVCFSSLCDIQHTLPFKSRDEIERESKDLLTYWTTDRGGFILSDYGNGEAIGVSDDKKQIMLDAFLKYDPWKKKQASI